MQKTLSKMLKTGYFLYSAFSLAGLWGKIQLPSHHRHSGRIKSVILAESVARQNKTIKARTSCVSSVLLGTKSEKQTLRHSKRIQHFLQSAQHKKSVAKKQLKQNLRKFCVNNKNQNTQRTSSIKKQQHHYLSKQKTPQLNVHKLTRQEASIGEQVNAKR